jgi:hypothetical protein
MSGTPSSPTNRAMLDANVSFTVTGPNVATGANGTLLDLGQTAMFPVNERVDVQIVVPAMPSLANTKTATFTVVDSADSNSSNASAIAAVATVVITGGASGGAATTVYRKLPGATRQYIGLQSAGVANGGDNSAVTITANLTF